MPGTDYRASLGHYLAVITAQRVFFITGRYNGQWKLLCPLVSTQIPMHLPLLDVPATSARRLPGKDLAALLLLLAPKRHRKALALNKSKTCGN